MTRFLGGLSFLFLAIVSVPASSIVPQGTSASQARTTDEEFAGPFPSWTNLKSAYRAVGDGAADDTAAFQNALNDLGKPGHSPVLFIPNGRYRITKTLRLEYGINLSVVGEAPASVTIVWDGEPRGTMLLVNGIAYSRFTRLTFDGRGVASVAVEQSWDNLKPNFDTGNEYSDHVFTGVEYGIHGGFKGFGFAETSIVRSKFIRNTKAGVALGNFNALDIWIWYSMFEDCGIGVTNEPGAGNFRVYGSIFRRSTVADLYIKNTGGFSARGNYSSGSKAFYLSAGPIGHPATIEIQGNTILDPVDDAAIRLGNQGPGLLLDNVIRSRASAVAPIVIWRSFIDADVTSIGNTFSVASPISTNGRLISIDDRIAARTASSPAEPSLPETLPNLKRPVIEVAAGSDGGAIQRAIDSASLDRGTRPIVHLPSGTYNISNRLTIASGELQLVGDGAQTVLKWTGADRGPVLNIVGPAKATLREFQIDGASKADAIVVDTVDQPGSRVYMEGVQSRGGTQSNLFVDRVNVADVELADFGHAYSPQGVSVKIFGARATIFSGASSGNGLSYEVAQGGSLIARDLWYEGSAPRGFASVHDEATFTMQGSRIASPADTDRPAFSIANLNGRVTLLTNHLDDRIAVTGNGSRAEIVGLGTFREYRDSEYFVNTTVPPATVVMANSRQRTRIQGRFSPGTVKLRDTGAADPAMLRRLLADARSRLLPSPLTQSPAAATDVRMFRVWVSSGVNNVWIRALR